MQYLQNVNARKTVFFYTLPWDMSPAYGGSTRILVLFVCVVSPTGIDTEPTTLEMREGGGGGGEGGGGTFQIGIGNVYRSIPTESSALTPHSTRLLLEVPE